MSSIESLHRMTREDRDLDGIIVSGSDHLTAYNLYAEAYQEAGYIGQVYGLPRHLFEAEGIEEWAEQRGVLVKSLEDAALAMASVFRGVGLPLPERMPLAADAILQRFQDLLARLMPFDLVIDEQTADGRQARVSKTSMCGTWGAIAGTLRYFSDRFGEPQASIEGTQLPLEFLRRYAKRQPAEFTYDATRKHSPLMLQWKIEYSNFELQSGSERIEEFPPELAGQARHTLAEAMARGEARHAAVYRDRVAIEEVRQMYRRSGSTTPRLGLAELTAHYERQLEAQNVDSVQDFRAAHLEVHADDFVALALRKQLLALPATVSIRDREVEIDYDVEEKAATDEAGNLTQLTIGVARLRLPEKLARTMREEELPAFDRPFRFIVTRGQRGAVRASTLGELQDLLEGPWTPTDAPQGGAVTRQNRPKGEHQKQNAPRRGVPRKPSSTRSRKGGRFR